MCINQMLGICRLGYLVFGYFTCTNIEEASLFQMSLRVNAFNVYVSVRIWYVPITLFTIIYTEEE